MEQRIAERAQELLDKEYEVKIKGIVVNPETVDLLKDENRKELDLAERVDGEFDGDFHDTSVQVCSQVDDFQIAYVDKESGLGLPSPERLRNMVARVKVAGGGNIAHAHFDLFAALTSKYYDLDEEKMDEAEVSFEGENTNSWDDEDEAHIETLRFKARAEQDPKEFREDEVVEEVKEDLLGQAKEAVYSGEMVQDIEVNEKPPTDDEAELQRLIEEEGWRPDRIKVGELVLEFRKLLLGDDDEESNDEPVPVKIEEVGEDALR